LIEAPEMTDQQISEYLSQPLIAKLATINPDGSPQLSPIWFYYNEGSLFIATYNRALKVSNIKRSNEVSLLVDSTDGGIKLKGVLFKGKAELIGGDECKKIEKLIYDKYLTQEIVQQDSTAATFKRIVLASEDSVCIKFKPEKTVSWDYTRMKVQEMRAVY